MSAETLRFIADDGVELDGELDATSEATIAVVVLHPHPLYGGDRHNAVVQGMRRALLEHRTAVLTFDFRGVGASGGTHGHGAGERLDAIAAVGVMRARHPGIPIVLAGYSFGSLVGLATTVDDVAGWVAVAPPLVGPDDPAAATDPRPVLVVAACHDQFCPASAVADRVGAWEHTEFAELPNADHFLGGSVGAAAALVVEFVSRLAAR